MHLSLERLFHELFNGTEAMLMVNCFAKLIAISIIICNQRVLVIYVYT